ncbi:MAG: glycosyltransferase family 2 protein [Acidobacteriota bacterium]
MSPPTVTAVIPTYRRPALLRRAIESVLRQTYPHLTVAVFDNASGDETPHVVGEIARRDPRVRYHCHPSNLGAVANFQAGMDSVRTPYFSILSDDDVLLPRFYEHAFSCLARHPGASFFCGLAVWYDPALGTHRLHPNGTWREGLYRAGEATTQMVEELFLWTGALFATDVRDQAGPLEAIEASDILFMAKAAAHFSFLVSMVPCAIFSAWKGNTFRRMPPEEAARSFRVTADRLAALPVVSPAEAARIESILEEHLYRLMRGRLRASHLVQDWRSFLRDFRFLTSRGNVSFKQKIRLLRRAAKGYLQAHLNQRALRTGAEVSPSIDDLVRIYSAPGIPTNE